MMSGLCDGELQCVEWAHGAGCFSHYSFLDFELRLLLVPSAPVTKLAA
jgi:hypothetical protein